MENLLVNRLYLLIEEGDRYIFRHQHFHDFFSALHVANCLEEALLAAEEGAFSLPGEIADRLLPVYIRQMLGDYYGDYRNREETNPNTPLHALLGRLRNKKHEQTGYAVNNIIEVWRTARRGHILGEDLTNLDLTHVSMNGIFFSKGRAADSPKIKRAATTFAGSTITPATLLPQGHSGGVCNAMYRPDGKRVLSGSYDGTLKEWDAETGECLWTTPPYPGVHIAGCNMSGCVFATDDLQQTVRAFGGKLFSVVLRNVYVEQLRHHRRPVDIALNDAAGCRTLILTGANGSGKTSLMNGIVNRLAALSGMVAAVPEGCPEVHLSFLDDEAPGFEETFRKEAKSERYVILYFDAIHLLDHDKVDFFERLDKIYAQIEQAKNRHHSERAKTLQEWWISVECMLKELFADDKIKLVYNERTEETELWQGEILHNRRFLPHGYSAALDILGTLLQKWNRTDVSQARLQGLVLIDEPEGHLHVHMQQKLLPCLTNIFPHVQFIIATHSPFIVNSAKNALVFDLDDLEAVPVASEEFGLQGWSMDEILQDVLDIDSGSSSALRAALSAAKAIALNKKASRRAQEDARAAARAAYDKLDRMLNETNPLKKMLSIQMSAIGGVGDD